jgi:hypothetical protein
VWTAQQRYCTACAAAVLLGFVLLALYVDPTGLARLNPFSGEKCAPYEQQRTLSEQQQSHERLPSSESRKTSTEHDTSKAGATAPEQQSSQADYYACRLAVYTRQLALFTAALVVATVILIGTGIYQGVHLGRAADAAKTGINIAREEFEADQRPWISVKITPDEDLIILDDAKVLTGVELTFKNHGRTPAMGILFDVKMIDCDRNEIVPEQDKMSARLQAIPERGRGNGFALFPGETLGVGRQLIMTLDDSSPLSDEPDLRASLKSFVNGFVVGCVDYVSHIQGHGQTRFSYILAKSAPSNTIIAGVGGKIMKSDRAVPKDIIILKEMIIGNSAE